MAQNQQAYPVQASAGGISGVTVSGTPSASQVLTATSATAASWATPATAAVTSVNGETGTPTTSLQPGVVPKLTTVGMPLMGFYWCNAPAYGSTTMTASTWGYTFTAFPGTLTADPIGVKFVSLTPGNQGCGWYQTSTETAPNLRPWMRGRVKIGATAADQGFWMGWLGTGLNLAGIGAVTNYTIALSCETVTVGAGGKGQTTWQVTTKITGTVDYVDTLVPFTAAHEYSLYIAVNGADVVWAIYDHTTSTHYGGICTSKAQLPSATQALDVLYAGISGPGGAAVTLYFGPCWRGQFGPA